MCHIHPGTKVRFHELQVPDVGQRSPGFACGVMTGGDMGNAEKGSKYL